MTAQFEMLSNPCTRNTNMLMQFVEKAFTSQNTWSFPCVSCARGFLLVHCETSYYKPELKQKGLQALLREKNSCNYLSQYRKIPAQHWSNKNVSILVFHGFITTTFTHTRILIMDIYSDFTWPVKLHTKFENSCRIQKGLIKEAKSEGQLIQVTE